MFLHFCWPVVKCRSSESAVSFLSVTLHNVNCTSGQWNHICLPLSQHHKKDGDLKEQCVVLKKKSKLLILSFTIMRS